MNANEISATDFPGANGQFDIFRDGELVFSKRESGRFPDDGEILAMLQAQ